MSVCKQQAVYLHLKSPFQYFQMCVRVLETLFFSLKRIDYLLFSLDEEEAFDELLWRGSGALTASQRDFQPVCHPSTSISKLLGAVSSRGICDIKYLGS